MRSTVEELEAFYASPEGALARRLLAARLRAIWPDCFRRRVLGYGYPTPYLEGLDAERMAVLMPGPQGARAWPAAGPYRVAVGRGAELPFADGAFDRILVAHGLEMSRDKDRLLRELWRVCEDGGKMIVIAPNRRGAWAWSDVTPFGHGQPYSRRQLEASLEQALFEPLQIERALFAPPIMARHLTSSAAMAERPCLRVAPGLAGALIVEAAKTIYAATPLAKAVAAPGRRRYATASANVSAGGLSRRGGPSPPPEGDARDALQRPMASMS